MNLSVETSWMRQNLSTNQNSKDFLHPNHMLKSKEWWKETCWSNLRKYIINMSEWLDEFGSIEAAVRPNRDLSNDRGEGVIGDTPLLHMKRLSSFWIERNNQEEECLNLLFKHAWLQIWPILPNEKSNEAKTENFAYVSIVHYNVLSYSINLMSTRVPEEAQIKSILLAERDFWRRNRQISLS